MILNKEKIKDKIHACWIGKNIGGTMGAPYEGTHDFLDVKGFTTEKNVIIPNDDLDLQLVWLRAVEICGAKNVTAQMLGEFWLSYVVPHWNEYGIAKNNMKCRLYPPLSGDAFTTWKNSNGAWIRTEIWACLAPCAVDVATKYAYRDACIDHGALGEGTIAAVFVAALESAAFIETDIRKLINLGLSRIPENSRVAKSVRAAIKFFDDGQDYASARNAIQKMNSDIGNGWFEAPSNVAYVVIGLLWGDGDFKKSMICAINCGDDTDCTAGTLGAILGIRGGTDAIPKDWKEHIGDKIETVCVARCVLMDVPNTCAELTERILNVAPNMLFENGAAVALKDGETEIPIDAYEKIMQNKPEFSIFEDFPYSYSVDFLHTKATVIYPTDPKILPMETVKVKLRFSQNRPVNGGGHGAPYFISLRWWLPDGFSVKCDNCLVVPQVSAHTDGFVETEAEITAPEKICSFNRLVIEASADGKMTLGYIPITLLG